MSGAEKQKILVVDDSEMNRSILMDILDSEYEIIEAEDGMQAIVEIEKYGTELSLVLLDIVMPRLDGFGVLEYMKKNHWIEDIPVIMISAETSSPSVERAYELGVTDFISRPFDALIVHRRAVNTILLYAKQKRLAELVVDTIHEKEEQNGLMIDILSHIVEFRNGESGQHVLHVRKLTEFMLEWFNKQPDTQHFTKTEISLISTASALHDVGKIAISESVLNKPGRLTETEFAIMKTHSMVGATMLKELPIHHDDPLVKTAYEICRWHHERYDGRGYPDGLKGDEIPLSAQIVSLADVYDALTSERVYKKAFTHEEAIAMILDGKCGCFNPKLYQCLKEMGDSIPERLSKASRLGEFQQDIHAITEEVLNHKELSTSERTLRILEKERMKYQFFASMSQEIQFEYVASPAMVKLNEWGTKYLGLDEVIMNPTEDEKACSAILPENLEKLRKALASTTPENPLVQMDLLCRVKGESRWMRIICRAMWTEDEPPKYTGVIGKAVDVHDARMRMDQLMWKVCHDPLTGLMNREYAKQCIAERMESQPEGRFVLAMVDLDQFKETNDNFGHGFGDQVIQYAADKLRKSAAPGDILARVGGDEFLIFMEVKSDVSAMVDHVFKALISEDDSSITASYSMGVADSDTVGEDFDALFEAADQALYTAKHISRGKYCFYNKTMQGTRSALSGIDRINARKVKGDNKWD